LQVAAVAAAAFAAVGFFGQARAVVVGRVAVGVAVGHDLVDGVPGGEALALGRAGFARQQLVAVVGGWLARRREADVERAGLGAVVQREVDEQVVAVGYARYFLDAHARIADGRLQVGDLLAVHHQLQRLAAHAHPPVGRLHMVDAIIFAHGGQGAGGQQGGCDQAFHGASPIFIHA
jgi:hypothetical protein